MWDHVTTPLGRPWWMWATTKQLNAVVSRRDAPQPVRECPWCLNPTVSFGTGRFRRHTVEPGVPCRASGLSYSVALRVIRGVIGNRPVEWMLEPFEADGRDLPRNEDERDAFADAREILLRVATARHEQRVTYTAISKHIDYPPTMIRHWEEGTKRIGLLAVLRIASMLALSLALRRDGKDVRVTTPASVREALTDARETAMLTQADVARSLGLSADSIREREKDRCAMAVPLVTACQWAVAVGCSLVVQ